MSVPRIFEKLEHQNPAWVCFKTDEGSSCINLRHILTMVYRSEDKEVEVTFTNGWRRRYSDDQLSRN